MVDPTRSQTITEVKEAPAEDLIRMNLIVPPRPSLSERMGAVAGNVLNPDDNGSVVTLRPVTPAKEQSIAERIRRNKETAEKRQAELQQAEEEEDRMALQQMLAIQTEMQQNVNIGDIINEICTLPLSDENQLQLEQWIKDFLDTNNVQRQLVLAATLIFNFLRPMVEEFPEELILANLETRLEQWIAQRLPAGQNIDAFKLKCRKALVIKAAQDLALTHLNQYGRQLLRNHALGVQQTAQGHSDRILDAMSRLQQQRQSQQISTTAIDTLSEQLQEEESKLRVHINNIGDQGEQLNVLQAGLKEQLNRLIQEVRRL